MFLCGRGSGTCGPPGRICCYLVPCIPRGQTHSHWLHHTRCCDRNLPGPLHLRKTQPATSQTLRHKQTGRGEREGLINGVHPCGKIKVDHLKCFFMLWQVWLFTVLAKKQSSFYSRGDIKQKEERASQTGSEATENQSFFSLKAAFQRAKINPGA